MPTRICPRHVRDVIKEYDSDIDIIWDDETVGWYFTYQGVRQPSCLSHPDGSWIVNLNGDEIRSLLNEMDLHKRRKLSGYELSKKYERAKRNRQYRHELAVKKRREEVTPEARKIADWSRRNRTKVGDSAKPFVEIRNNKVISKDKGE